MSRALAVLRPEPGNAATAARIVAHGGRAIRLPLFAVHALDWTPPATHAHDALLLTSANTLRHGGANLAALHMLPVLAVGRATAEAARTAGFDVALTGDRDAAHLLTLAASGGHDRILHLGGRDRTVPATPLIAASIAVYASEPLPITLAALAALDGSVALLHSARAARRLAALVDPARLRIAALSAAVLAAAGPGWHETIVAPAPDDAALIAAALSLAD